MTYPSGPLREPGPMAQPPKRDRRCPDDGSRLRRNAAGLFSCKKCKKSWSEAELRSEGSD
jgi:ribosomal protein L37AE/L43A